MYTPDPLRREGSQPLTHYWSAEFQAVPWLGAMDAEGHELSLADRAGLPLGRYRFNVVGNSFEIASDPFEVQAAPLAVAAARNGNTITLSVSIFAPKSYRLLDMELASNASIPLRDGVFEVTFARSGGPDIVQSLPVTSDGQITADLGVDAASVTSVTVQDPHGNQGVGAVN
jgi:hypothetical protein